MKGLMECHIVVMLCCSFLVEAKSTGAIVQPHSQKAGLSFFRTPIITNKWVSCRTAETHELAKRKANEMNKIRTAFGLDPEAKEGQAFDRDLQERLKAERILEREAQQKAKEKEAKKREKEKSKKEKEQKKLKKKKDKEDKKVAQLKAEVVSTNCKSNRGTHYVSMKVVLAKLDTGANMTFE